MGHVRWGMPLNGRAPPLCRMASISAPKPPDLPRARGTRTSCSDSPPRRVLLSSADSLCIGKAVGTSCIKWLAQYELNATLCVGIYQGITRHLPQWLPGILMSERGRASGVPQTISSRCRGRRGATLRATHPLPLAAGQRRGGGSGQRGTHPLTDCATQAKIEGILNRWRREHRARPALPFRPTTGPLALLREAPHPAGSGRRARAAALRAAGERSPVKTWCQVRH